MLTPTQLLITIIAVAIGAQLTRFLPFVIFPENKEIPKSVVYLGRVLPPAVLALLVVQSFKNTAILSFPYGIPELLAAVTVIILYFWRKNTLLSIIGGTAMYMVLVQLIF